MITTGWKIHQMKDKVKEIESYLDFLYPNPKCELNYNKDYELLIATVLSAQTTDKRVNSVTNILFSKYDTLEKLRDADINDIKNIIKPIGTFNKKSEYVKSIAAYLIENCSKVVPNDREIIEKIPGAGRKTANVVLNNLYDFKAIAVDTPVARVSKRLGLCKEHDDVLTIEKKLEKKFKKSVWGRRHHQMVLFGRYNCKAQNPSCTNCKISNLCKFKNK